MRTSFTHYTPLLESARPAVQTAKGSLFKGVTLIRAGMGNRKDKNYYPPETLKKAVPMFNGLRAFADHPDSVSEEIQPERSIRDMVGIYENARYDAADESIKADLHIFKKEQWLADTINELIQIGHADKIGLSINGQGATAPYRMTLSESGEEMDVNRVERFVHLRSTDIVTEAGAGGGFTEMLESARAEALQETPTMSLLAAIKEATDKGDLKQVQKLLADAEKAGKAQEAAKTGKRPGAKKPAETEADDEAEATDEDDDTVVDPNAELDAAVEAAHADNEPSDEDDEDDEDDAEGDDADDADGDDAEGEAQTQESDDETPETQIDATRGQSGKDAKSAHDRFKAHQSRAREAAIKGATGKKTGTVNKGVGSFTKREKTHKRSSTVPQKAKQVFRTRESAAGNLSEVAQLRRAIEKRDQRIDELTEALRVRKSVDSARKLLKESGLPPETRALMLDDLVGLDPKAQQREIQRQTRLIESIKGSVKDDLFDEIEGTGTTLRESFAGGGTGDSFDDLFAEVGLTLKG